jgi:hypothetical protein
MKRFFLVLLSILQQQLKLYLQAAIIGAIIGIFILAPSYNYIYDSRNTADALSSFQYIIKQIHDLVTGRISEENAALILFYGEVGAVLGIVSLVLYKLIHDRLAHLDSVKNELHKDLAVIIQQGEGAHIEFKSSLRWDRVEERTNRALEQVVLKTLAGFLNSHKGGTLLIGVADNGDIVGLEKDYQTLKKPDQDGFEQTLMTSIAANLGADLCQFVHILFHSVDETEVCRLIIQPAPRPVYLEQNNAVKFFVRTGGGTRDLNIKEAVDYIYGRWTYPRIG